MADAPEVKAGGKKLPKWFLPVGIGVAVILGLYLRSRSQSSSSSSAQTAGSSDVTGNPAYYDANAAYNDPYGYGSSSPYGMGSFLANSGLPSNFDPTSFEEGIQYESGALGGTIPGSSSVPTTNGGSSPGGVTINVDALNSRTSGKPNVSGRTITTHPAGGFYKWFKKAFGHAPPKTVNTNSLPYQAWLLSLDTHRSKGQTKKMQEDIARARKMSKWEGNKQP